jgi:hypothetical protein
MFRPFPFGIERVEEQKASVNLADELPVAAADIAAFPQRGVL